METDTAAAPASRRPRPILLVLFGIVIAAFVWMRLGDSAGTGSVTSNASRPAQQTAGDGQIDPSVLDVRLESLEGGRPEPGGVERNPFRFQPKAAPAPEQPPSAFKPEPGLETGPQETVERVPPITVKFLGTMNLQDGTVLALITDCETGRRTDRFREGAAVFGQYRLVTIGQESIVIEHLDGRGRTTLPKTGQECVWK